MTLAPEDAGVTPDAEEPRRAPRRRWFVVPWVVAALAIGVAAFATIEWQDLQAAEDARTEVAVAATNFLTELTNWEHGGLDDTVASLRELGTGRFLTQVDELFGGPVATDLEVARATSEGEVVAVAVQSVGDDRAEVFGVVRQHLASTATDGTETTHHLATLLLERVDGVWRVEHLETEA